MRRARIRSRAIWSGGARWRATTTQFLSGLKLYDHTLTAQEQLILRVTRVFGECEMAAPPEYLAEVASYIRKWQATSGATPRP